MRATPTPESAAAPSGPSSAWRAEPAFTENVPAPRASRPLSICMVWQADYPWDVRAEKVAAALTEAGHRVTLVARNRLARPEVEQLPEATVRRLRRWRWAPQWLDDVTTFPAFLNPRWLRHILHVARQTRADVILCRDLPLAVPSILVARRLGIPVVLDMAENYPAMLRLRRSTGRRRVWDNIVRNSVAAQRIERWVLPRVDGVLVVVEESRQRVMALGVPPARVVLVSNTPPLARLDLRPAAQLGEDTLRVVYLGRVEAQRGIGTLLEAAALLRSEGFPLALTIYGGGADLDLFRQRAVALALAPPMVVFRGQVSNAAALSELTQAHVGIIPHWRGEHCNTTVPNKLFDYMAAGLAVVTSDAAPLKRIVEACGCGLAYQDRDAADLARVLRRLRDATVRREAARRGRVAVQTTYHWERDVARLLHVVGSVVAG